MKKKLSILTWIINLAVITACLAPISQQIPSPFTRSDLFYHASSYLALTFLYLLSDNQVKKVVPLLLIQGIAIEFIQPYFGRFFEFYDILANSLGVLFGFLFFKFSQRYFPKKSTGPAK